MYVFVNCVFCSAQTGFCCDLCGFADCVMFELVRSPEIGDPMRSN